MPAADFVKYCASCDLEHSLAKGADFSVRVATPRRLATKTDVDGTPLCAQCLEYRREDRRIDLYERHADAAFEAAERRKKM